MSAQPLLLMPPTPLDEEPGWSTRWGERREHMSSAIVGWVRRGELTRAVPWRATKRRGFGCIVVDTSTSYELTNGESYSFESRLLFRNRAGWKKAWGIARRLARFAGAAWLPVQQEPGEVIVSIQGGQNHSFCVTWRRLAA